MREEEEEKGSEEESITSYIKSLDPQDLALTQDQLHENIRENIQYHLDGVPDDIPMPHHRVILKNAVQVHHGTAAGIAHILEQLPTKMEVH